MPKKLKQVVEPDRLASFLLLLSEQVPMQVMVSCLGRTNWQRALEKMAGVPSEYVKLIRHLAAELRKELEVKS